MYEFDSKNLIWPHLPSNWADKECVWNKNVSVFTNHTWRLHGFSINSTKNMKEIETPVIYHKIFYIFSSDIFKWKSDIWG